MKQVGDSTYTVGKIEQKELTRIEKQVLRTSSGSSVQSCTRIFHQGTLYHSRRYAKGLGKRDSTICSFMEGGLQKFGQIEFFPLIPEPMVLVREMKSSPSTSRSWAHPMPFY